MNHFQRNLELFVDGTEVAQGCHICLSAREEMTLRPALHRLDIWELSESSKAMLSSGKQIEIRSDSSILTGGELMDVYSHRSDGKMLTSIIFSPGYSLWQSSVSLSLAAGMKVSDTMRTLLNAASSPESSPFNLSTFTGENPAFTRPQSFFGRTCDALTMLAQTADSDIFLDTSGVCVLSRDCETTPCVIPESDILSIFPAGSSRWILSTSMLSLPLGIHVQVVMNGNTYSGRILSRMIQADNVSGPWKAELELGREL